MAKQKRTKKPALPELEIKTVAFVLEAPRAEAERLEKAAKVAAQPLWFLAVYLVVVALAPGQLAVHRRHPWLVLVEAEQGFPHRQ